MFASRARGSGRVQRGAEAHYAMHVSDAKAALNRATLSSMYGQSTN